MLIALLLAGISLGGLLTGAYDRETDAWVEQAIAQDWFDLVVVAPWLAICWLEARHSYRWKILLAGGYAYSVYTLAIYAFAVHFNALFVLYCAALGVATYALLQVVLDLARRVEPVRTRLAGTFLVAIGVSFAALWLSEDIPAIVAGRAPDSLAETGLLSNPVHVLDYAYALPAHVLGGIWLLRKRQRGFLVAPIVLAFGVPMAGSIGVMLAFTGALGIALVMLAIAATTAAILARSLQAP